MIEFPKPWTYEDTVEEVGSHIYLPPQTIIEMLGKITSEEEYLRTRNRLADAALELHDAALARSLIHNRVGSIPTAATWPSIVGEGPIATMALMRRQNRRQLVADPLQPTWYLLVPRKKDILRLGY